MIAAFTLSVLAVVVSVIASIGATRSANQRVEDVARALSEPVAQRVLAEGRAESAEAARGVLRAANGRLIANQLPIVPEPPVDALSVIVQLQANRAQLLADFGTVDFIAEGFRQRFGEAGAFPASFLDRIPATAQPDPTAVPADGVVEVLPGDDGPTVVIEPPADRGTANSREPRTSAPQPSPAPRRTVTQPAPARPAPAAPPAPAPNRDRGLCLLGVILCGS